MIEHDWPLLASGQEVDIATNLLINPLVSDLHKLSGNSNSPSFALQEMTKEATVLRSAQSR